MKRPHHLTRKTVLLTFMIALLHTLAFNAQGKGKGFKDIVNHLETKYRAKKVRIPLLGLANFAVKLVRPAGVKGFKLAVFENQDFALRDGDEPFEAVMRKAYADEWQPLVLVTSKRGGHSRVLIYSRNDGKDVQFALLALEAREAVVLEVKFHPDAAVRFLDNPKIMGISLGKSIRGNSNVANRSASNSSGAKDVNQGSTDPGTTSVSTGAAEPA